VAVGLDGNRAQVLVARSHQTPLVTAQGRWMGMGSASVSAGAASTRLFSETRPEAGLAYFRHYFTLPNLAQFKKYLSNVYNFSSSALKKKIKLILILLFS
jgi:hypothetical protein